MITAIEPTRTSPLPGSPATRARQRVSPQRLLWWAIPLVGLTLVLLASYSSLTHRRYPHANEPLGELLQGQSVGQSFVARYPHLSGVEVLLGTYGRGSLPSTSSLVLHLREAPGLPDLATARLPTGQVLGENPWYLFSFPPQADSQGKSYYIEIEAPDASPGNALTLFWWRAVLGSDPYATGGAYRDGKPAKGDLAFGLRYSPSPPAAWLQVVRAASVNFPTPLMAAMLLAALAAIVWAIVRRASRLRAIPRPTRLPRGALAIALFVGLTHGLLHMFLVPPWQAPDEYAHFAYAALLDRHNLDDAAVKSSYLRPGAGDILLVQAVNTSMFRHDFTRRVAGYAHPGFAGDVSPVLLQEVRQPPAYYWLAAAALRVARSIGWPADPYANPEVALKIMRGVSVALSLIVIALAWLAGVLLSWHGPLSHKQGTFAVRTPARLLPLLLPLALALLPMRAFTDSVANNDVLAEVAVSALFVALLALFRWPHGWKGSALAALAVSLTFASATTKATALAASVPLLILGLAVWAGIVAARALETRGRYRLARRAVPLAFAVPFLLAAGTLLLAFEASPSAPGWEISREPLLRAPRVGTATALDGAYALQLGGEPPNSAASQVIVPRTLHPGFTLTVTGSARLPETERANRLLAAGARLIIRVGEKEVGVGAAKFTRAGQWVPLAATATIAESGEPVILWLSAEADGRPVQFDALTLRAEGLTHPWPGPVFKLGLLNGSAESGAAALRPGIAELLPYEASRIADVLANPLPFDVQALWTDYARTLYDSFWGNFGWFSLALPGPIYALLTLAVLLASGALVWRAFARGARWGAHEWLALISIISLAIAVLIAFARQTTLTAVTAIPAYPQGRYLFVLAIPLLWLLMAGLWTAWSSLWSATRTFLERYSPGTTARTPKPEAFDPQVTAPRLAWGSWLWVNALALFAAYCALVLIAPYFYG